MHDYKKRETYLLADFAFKSDAEQFLESYMFNYIENLQGQQNILIVTEPPNIKYGFYILRNNELINRYTVVERIRHIGNFWNSYEDQKHFDIFLVNLPKKVIINFNEVDTERKFVNESSYNLFDAFGAKTDLLEEFKNALLI